VPEQSADAAHATKRCHGLGRSTRAVLLVEAVVRASLVGRCSGRAAVVSAKADHTPAPPRRCESARRPTDLALVPRPLRASHARVLTRPLAKTKATLVVPASFRTGVGWPCDSGRVSRRPVAAARSCARAGGHGGHLRSDPGDVRDRRVAGVDSANAGLLGVTVLVTGVVFWLAHVYARVAVFLR
jgi:hypothetical protein